MNAGKLYIIASPIGNMEDITLRALRILKNDIDIIYCEDTRQTRKILTYYDISIPIKSLHTHSSDKKTMEAVDAMLNGKNIGYLTDSGTPGISDPGNKLVSAARRNNIIAVPIPGPSAITTLVSCSGFTEKNIIFGGFLSKKDGKRKRELEKLNDAGGVIVLYESPYRIKKLNSSIYETFPDSELVIGREMTKQYEEFISGRTQDIFNDIDNITEKGEFAIAILNKKMKNVKK